MFDQASEARVRTPGRGLRGGGPGGEAWQRHQGQIGEKTAAADGARVRNVAPAVHTEVQIATTASPRQPPPV